MDKFKTTVHGIIAVNAAFAAWKEVRHMANDGMAERVKQAIAAWNSRDWYAVRRATKGYDTTGYRSWHTYTPSGEYVWRNGAASRAYDLLHEIAIHTPAVVGQDSHRRRGVVPYIAYAASHADAARKAAEWKEAHPRCTTSFRAAGNLANLNTF